MKTRPHISRPRFLPLIAALLAAFPMVAEAEIAGHFQFVSGDVRVIDAANRERAPKKGDGIHEGDTIVTAPSSSAQVLMMDKGFLAVRPDTRLKIDTFKYAGKEDGSERGFFSLLRGGFRAITGAVGNLNKQNYVIKTPAATIGIRGTDHEPMYIAPPLPGEKPLGPPGAYDKVNVGAAFIRTEQGTANVGPNQVGYAAGGNTAPTVLTTLPAFYKATPAPETRKQEEKKTANGAAGTTAGTAKAKDTSTSNDAAATETTTATTGETATTATGTTTSTTDTTAGAEPIRTTTSTDTALLGPVATTTGTAPTTSSTSSATSTSTTTTSNATLTATDSSGSTLNLATQTTTTSSGTTTGLTTTMQAPSTIVLTSYAYSDANCIPCSRSRDLFGKATFDASGRLLGIVENSLDSEQRSETVNAGVASTGTVSQATTAGVSFGRWSGVTLSGTDSNDSGAVTFANRAPIGSYHWVAGPDVAPGFLPMILTGTSTYTIDGYTLPTDHTNIEGTLNTANTTLSYNFGTQSASAHIDATVNSRRWIADASNIMMHGEGGFSAYTGNDLNEQNLTLTMTYGANTYTSTAMTAWGSLNGSLFGPSLAGAGLTYAFNAADNSSVSGAIAYTGSAQSTAPFKGVLMAIGDTGAPGTYKEEFKTWVDGGFSAVGRVTGAALDGHYPVTFNQSCSGGTCISARDIPVTYTNVSTTVDPGSDGITGITWGRWDSVTAYNRITSASLGVLLSPVHFIISPEQSGPVALPVTGTATYTFAGGTSPTSFGNTGTLDTATLAANFTNKTVDLNLALTMPASQSWSASASGIPIHNGAYFEARNMPSGQNTIPALNVSCTGGSCGGSSYGQVIGAFTGTSGQGAAVAYSLNNPTAATTVSGVAAFRK